MSNFEPFLHHTADRLVGQLEDQNKRLDEIAKKIDEVSSQLGFLNFIILCTLAVVAIF